MGLFEKIGLGRKKARPVGQKLEKGREAPGRSKQTKWAFKVGILLALVLLTLAAFPRGNVYQYTVDVGDEWRREALVAPFDFPIYKSSEELALEREELRERTPPYFRQVADAQDRMTANRDTVARQLQRIFDAYGSYRLSMERGRPSQSTDDSLRYMRLRRDARLKATPEQWQMLAASYAETVPELPSATREPAQGPRLDQELLNRAWEIGAQLLNVGVLDVPLDSVRAEQVYIRDEVSRSEMVKSKDNLYGLNEAYQYADRQFQQIYANSAEVANLGTSFFRSIFTPSLSYMRSETIQEYQRLEQRISPTRGRVSEDDVIVEKGQRVTEQIRAQLTSLERSRQERGGDNILWRVLLGQFLVALSTYFIFFLYLYLLRRHIFDDNRKVMLLAILFAGIIGMFAVAIRVETIAMYIVPVAIAPVLFTVMFDSRVGLFGALTLALIGGQLLSYDFEFTFATIFAATLGVFSVRDIKNRGQFFISAGLVFVGYLVVLGATAVFFGVPRDLLFSDLLLVAVNSFLLIVAYPLLWVFERSFDITTDLSLLELSDTNRPLLKELSLRAPGTFNHSLQVANLSEAAADAIGANALLTRVGALYHDIGKMLKPEYFVENQRPGSNPHTQLKPRMSALIIASHVKEGLEMGRQYNLPQRVLDFIPMHHGTTRIEFFYRKALDQRKESDPEILESEFRYPGPRPKAKETGILMLADSVEAASRSLSDPTHKRLETLIDMIFTARIEDGQLDQTDLTFRDLTQIKDTFLSMLLGVYHVRVKYPGQDEQGERDAEARQEREPAKSKPPPETLENIREGGLVGTPEQGVRPRAPAGDKAPPSDKGPVGDNAADDDEAAVGERAPDGDEVPAGDNDAKPDDQGEKAGETDAEREAEMDPHAADTGTGVDKEREPDDVHAEEGRRAQEARRKAAERGAGPGSEEEVESRARNAGVEPEQGNGASPMETDVSSEDEAGDKTPG